MPQLSSGSFTQGNSEVIASFPLPVNPPEHLLEALPEGNTAAANNLEVTQTVQRQENIHLILESLGFALRNFKNLNQYLEILPSMIARITDADAAMVLLFRKAAQQPSRAVHCRSKDNCSEVTSSIEHSLHETWAVFSENDRSQASYWEDLETTLTQKLAANKTTATVRFFTVKIILDNGDRGRLYIFTSDVDYEWSSDRQKLMQIVADQTAVAVANEELTAELRKRDLLHREVEIGAEIQERLLPRACPDIPGMLVAACYQNANRVSGDYYDFIPANYDRVDSRTIDPSSKWGITIGDVMGKGVPAGLIMTMTRGMLRAEVLNGNSPAKILQNLNRVMYLDLDNSSRFVTLFYSDYDPNTRILTYSNAAHNPPLLWRAGQLQPLDTPGMLIGLEPDSVYEEAQVQLQSGDTILYYTDGLTDASNQNGQRFDEANLHQAFDRACTKYAHPQEIIDRIFAEIREFAGTQEEQNDDMTAAILKLV
jgi:phosphoserine phosphatase RsbU/P